VNAVRPHLNRSHLNLSRLHHSRPHRRRLHVLGAWLVVPVLAALVLTACGDDNKDTTSPSIQGTTTTEATTASGPVKTATNATLGTILVDDKGLTLYVFDADQNGTIACGTGCTTAWPPLLLTSGASLPTVGPLSGDLSTVNRPDGGAQVAYKGRPLYRFASDTAPGDAKGDNVGNVWHVAKVS
jgi:predicted lipoprotein with Yx(FWY)xxD motif